MDIKVGNTVSNIDDEDYERAKEYSWHINEGYGRARINNKMVYLHRFIIGGTTEIDHINRDRLDNRKCNLRFVTRSLNNLNRTAASCIEKRGNSYRARVEYGKKRYSLGSFATKEQAEQVVQTFKNQLFQNAPNH